MKTFIVEFDPKYFRLVRNDLSEFITLSLKGIFKKTNSEKPTYKGILWNKEKGTIIFSVKDSKWEECKDELNYLLGIEIITFYGAYEGFGLDDKKSEPICGYGLKKDK